MKDLNKKNWNQLVKDVNEHNLEPVQTMGDLEKAIDDYITEHDVHFVLGEHRYFCFYNNEWLRLSWWKLRTTCPVVFTKAEYYKKYEALMLSRLKKMGRIHRGAVVERVSFR